MSSEEQIRIIAPARNKLILDSEQQERKQQQERQRLEQIQKRKEEKRKKRQQAEKLEMQKLKQQEEKQKKYEQPEMMFEQDSDDGVEFKRVVKKIKRAYPDQLNKYEVQAKKRNDFIVPDNQDDSEDQSDSDSYDQDDGQSSQSHKKPKKQQKAQKKEKKVEKKVVQKKPMEKKKVQAPVKKQKIKIEDKNDLKEHLVKLVSVRWWYALPEWPPADFDYNGKLKELGYRVLDAEKFKLEEDIVNGLQKCMPVEGYIGVYKSKTKLIDVRPKQSAPTLNNFRRKTIEELNEILKRALTAQMQQLRLVKHQQKGESELLVNLEKTLNKRK